MVTGDGLKRPSQSAPNEGCQRERGEYVDVKGTRGRPGIDRRARALTRVKEVDMEESSSE